MSSPGSGSKRSREAGSEAVAEEAPAAAWAAAPQPPSAQQAAALVAELAAAEAQATNEPAALAERARLYLPRDGLLESTNARVVAANGTQLPVHSQILKVAAKEVEEELEGEPEGTPEDPFIIEGLFEDYSVPEVSLFLKLVYSPELMADRIELARHYAVLPRVVHLAKELCADKMTATLCKVAIEGPVTVAQLTDLVNIAEELNFADSRMAGLNKLRGLFAQPWRLPAADAASLAHHLSSRSLARLLLDMAAEQRRGSFEFSAKLAGAAREAASQPFTVAGLSWRVVASKGDAHVGVHVECLTGIAVRVRCTITVRSQSSAEGSAPDVARTWQDETLTAASPRVGTDLFMPKSDLHKGKGYAVDGAIRIKAGLQLLL